MLLLGEAGCCAHVACVRVHVCVCARARLPGTPARRPRTSTVNHDSRLESAGQAALFRPVALQMSIQTQYRVRVWNVGVPGPPFFVLSSRPGAPVRRQGVGATGSGGRCPPLSVSCSFSWAAREAVLGVVRHAFGTAFGSSVITPFAGEARGGKHCLGMGSLGYCVRNPLV